MNKTVTNFAATLQNRDLFGKYVVTAVAGRFVSLDVGGGEIVDNVPCLSGYITPTVGDVVRVIFPSPRTIEVLGSLPIIDTTSDTTV